MEPVNFRSNLFSINIYWFGFSLFRKHEDTYAIDNSNLCHVFAFFIFKFNFIHVLAKFFNVQNFGGEFFIFFKENP